MPDPNDTNPPAPAPVSPILAAFGMEPVNAQAAAELRAKYGADLTKTQGALSQVNAQREDITTRNLRAIDEAISGLKNSRNTGMIGLDPAVSAAMAAGFLKTTPGVASNFGNELGNAMGFAAPVIARKQEGDRDSFALLAELQRKKGEYEAEPIKEQQAELRAREKEQMANIKEVEKASLRAPASSADKIKIDNERLVLDYLKSLEPEIKFATEDKQKDDGQPLSAREKEAIRRYLTNQRAIANNAGKTPDSPGYIDPARVPASPEDIALAERLLPGMTPMLKGTDKMYDDYVRSEKANNRVPLPREGFDQLNRSNATYQAEQAKDDAEKVKTAPAALRQADSTIALIDQIIAHPGTDKIVGTGWERLPINVSRDASNAAALMKTFTSKAFLNGVQLMKGTGPLSNAEGLKVEQAIGAISQIQHPDDFRAALRDIQRDLAALKEATNADLAAIHKRRGGGEPAAAAPRRDAPSQEHIDMLKADPSLAEFFDKTYGPGAAAKVLGR